MNRKTLFPLTQYFQKFLYEAFIDFLVFWHSGYLCDLFYGIITSYFMNRGISLCFFTCGEQFDHEIGHQGIMEPWRNGGSRLGGVMIKKNS